MLDAPTRFGFFQLMRLWSRWFEEIGLAGVISERLRFHNSLASSFPPSEVAALWSRTDDNRAILTDQDLLVALQTDPDACIHITPACIGLLGASGVLPSHYTDKVVAAQRRQYDDGPRAFMDLLLHRAPLRFYEAWAAYRIECRPDRHDEPGHFLSMQLALAGRWPPQPDQATGSVSPEAIAHYAQLFRHQPATADVIAGVLADYFDVPVRFCPFVGDWYLREERCSLGAAHCTLGGGVMLGERCHRSDLAAEIILGPLPRRQYEGLLPGAATAQALEQMLALFNVATVRYRIRLVLQARDVNGARLSSTAGVEIAGLGRGLFLGAAVTGDRDDMCYEIAFPGAAAKTQRQGET
jgi:type VI secretion system protein ImpH